MYLFIDFLVFMIVLGIPILLLASALDIILIAYIRKKKEKKIIGCGKRI